MTNELVDPHAPIPTYPATLEQVVREQLRARQKYRDLVQRLGIGELCGLADVVGAELARRTAAEKHRQGVMAGQRIGR